MSTAAAPSAPTQRPQTAGACPPEQLVLSHLLDQHPRRLTLPELAGDLAHSLDPTILAHAVENLAAAEFVTKEGLKLAPAAAVVEFDRYASKPR